MPAVNHEERTTGPWPVPLPWLLRLAAPPTTAVRDGDRIWCRGPRLAGPARGIVRHLRRDATCRGQVLRSRCRGCLSRFMAEPEPFLAGETGGCCGGGHDHRSLCGRFDVASDVEPAPPGEQAAHLPSAAAHGTWAAGVATESQRSFILSSGKRRNLRAMPRSLSRVPPHPLSSHRRLRAPSDLPNPRLAGTQAAPRSR